MKPETVKSPESRASAATACWADGFQLPTGCSIDQWLSVWDELAKAYFGKNGFGGDTAEIYAYGLLRFDPRIVHDGLQREARREQAIQAREALWLIVRRFQQQWNCECEIDGDSAWNWFQKADFDHRCHVRVVVVQ